MLAQDFTSRLISLEAAVSETGIVNYSATGPGLSPENFTFSFATGRGPVAVHRLRISSFLNLAKADYRPIFYTLHHSAEAAYVALDMNGDSLFEKEHAYYGSGDTLELNFIPASGAQGPAVSIPVVPRISAAGSVAFELCTFHAGQLAIEGAIRYVTVWPFTLGPKISVGDGVDFDLLNTYSKALNPEEAFLLGGRKVKFTNYDYQNRTIELRPVDDGLPLSGYKENTIYSAWLDDKSPINWDSLGIARDRPYLIYFGAKWCGWCQPEIPKLRNLNERILSEKGVGIIAVIARHLETTAELTDYIETNQLPGIPVIQSMDSPDTFMHSLEISSYPSYVFIDRDGKIIYRSDYGGRKIHEFVYDYFVK